MKKENGELAKPTVSKCPNGFSAALAATHGALLNLVSRAPIGGIYFTRYPSD